MTIIRNTAYATYLLHVGGAKNVGDLLGVLTEYGESVVTLDMMQTALDMQEDSFTDFKAGIRREMMGGENTDQWLDKYGTLLLPPVYHRMIQFMELTQNANQAEPDNGPVGTA